MKKNEDLPLYIAKMEKEVGEVGFTKACISNLHKLLVSKGILTEKELMDGFVKELEEMVKVKKEEFFKDYELGRVGISQEVNASLFDTSPLEEYKKFKKAKRAKNNT